jgi:hypothetical protein
MLTFESEALVAGSFVAKSKTGNGGLVHPSSNQIMRNF